MIQLSCPKCQEEFPLSEARNDASWREFCQLLTQVPNAIQGPLLDYMELFKPLKHSNVRSSRMHKLTAELLPMIKAQSIERNNRSYLVNHSQWAGAMSHLTTNRGTLQLPLKGNGYLLTMLANHAEKREAKAEATQITKLRTAPAAEALKPEANENRRHKLIDINGQLMHAKEMCSKTQGDVLEYWKSQQNLYQMQLNDLQKT